MNPLIYVTLISLRSHSDKEKNKGNRKTGMTQAFRNEDQNNLLTLLFRHLEINYLISLQIVMRQ